MTTTGFEHGFDEQTLAIYHYVEPFGGCINTVDCGWVRLTPLAVDEVANTITVQTNGFSPFALGVPEPSVAALLAVGGLALLRRRPVPSGPA